MTPRERLLAAIRREDTDYMPCCPIFWSSPTQPGYEWTTDAERLEVCISHLGVDAVVCFNLPQATNPTVREHIWEERVPGELHPLIHKSIETPTGTLTCTVRRTEDWPHGADIPLMSDFVVSRIVKPWIQSHADLDCFEQVWLPPDITSQQVRESIRPIRELADRWQVPILLPTGYGWTLALSLFGTENAVIASVDQPDLLDRLAEIDHRVTMRKIELGIDAGVDILHRNGFYETCDFWSPAQIERHLVPRLQHEVALGHQANLPTVYTVCTGIMPMLKQLRMTGVDCLYGIEPVLGDQDMPTVVRELGPYHCIWSGLSAPIHIGRGTPETVRQAVREFYATFGQYSTILMATPSIRPSWPWENVMAMVDEWKALR
ncbi:MAG: uroporphyrinogen decarboxylase family protein [Candidatus Zipacnadales bacterium]